MTFKTILTLSTASLLLISNTIFANPTFTANSTSTKRESREPEAATGFVTKKAVRGSKFMVAVGQKYIKIGRVSDHTPGRMGSVWGFVVNTDNDKKFKKSDVLKAAGFHAPARNAPRGNVLDGGFNINWTGPEYL